MIHIKNFRLFESSVYEMPQDIKDKLHDDGEGNYLFYHYSNQSRDFIKPGTGENTLKTSREEISALSSIGGLAMFYTSPNYKEGGMGPWQHIVKIPHEEVYYFNGDALNFYDIAYEKFRKIYNGVNFPKLAFNPNYQVAWITKVANEHGYKMTVAKWSNTLRAQTTLSLTPDTIKKDSY